MTAIYTLYFASLLVCLQSVGERECAPPAALEFALEGRTPPTPVDGLVTVVVTARNSSETTLNVEATLTCLGRYEPSENSTARMGGIRDSIDAELAKAPPVHFKCRDPELPRFFVGSIVDPLLPEPDYNRVLEPGMAFSDTLTFALDRSQFAEWPGVITIDWYYLSRDPGDTSRQWCSSPLGELHLDIVVP